MLGDDGRHHLRDGSTVLCGDGWLSRCHVDPYGGVVHEQDHRSRTERWTVRLGHRTVVPESVPYGQRCSSNPGPWPTFHNPATRMGRIRIQLTNELGRHCHACRRGPTFAVDHDHFTGLIRGMLCRVCNTHVDHCPHLSGCPYADYLNNPPAARFQLPFPNARGNKPTAGDLLRIERLGLNPFAR